MSYATQADIEAIFGASNVRTWADLDNLGDEETIADRIEWALAAADGEVNDRLTGGPYALPIASPPASLIECAARIAGVKLYESRGIQDMGSTDEPADQMQPHRKMANAWLKLVKSAAVRLYGVTMIASNIPQRTEW